MKKYRLTLEITFLTLCVIAWVMAVARGSVLDIALAVIGSLALALYKLRYGGNDDE